MRKNIDIDETVLTKLKLIAALEDLSVKGLMEQAVSWYVEKKEKQRFDNLTAEEKEDVGLLILMQQVDEKDLASREEIMDILDKE